MDVAFDPSRWHFGATLRFEGAGTTLRHGAEILERVIGADVARRRQRLARRACIGVLHLVVDEVLARGGQTKRGPDRSQGLPVSAG